MDITFQKEDGCLRYYAIEAPWSDLEPKFHEVVHALRTHAHMPGFRPGKAPEAMLKGRFSKEIREEVLEHFLPDVAKALVAKFEIKPVEDPYAQEVNFSEGQPFSCVLVAEVEPEVPEVDSEGISLEVPKVEVTDQQVAKVMENLRQRAAVMKPLEEAAQRGDFVVANLLKKGQSKPFERFLMANPESGEAAEKAVAGLKVGDEADVEVAEEGHEGHDHDHQDHPGHTHLAPGQYHITVAKVVRREVPEENDDFAKDMGAETIDALRAKVRADTEAQVQRDVRGLIEDKLIESLLAKYAFPLPQTLVRRQLKADLEDLAEGLVNQGMDLGKAKVNWEKIADSREPVAAKKVAAFYLLEAVAKRRDLLATEEDLNAYFAAKAEHSGVSTEKFRAHVEKEGRLESVRTLIAHKKALDLLISRASVTFTEGKAATQEEENAPDSDRR